MVRDALLRRRSSSPAPSNLRPGWRWIYTRGYDVSAPASFAFDWLARRSPEQSSRVPEGARSMLATSPEASGLRFELRRYPSRGMERTTLWEMAPPNLVIFHDSVFRKGRLLLEGEERYQFLSAGTSGCIAEVTALCRPVDRLSRIGFALAPMSAARTPKQEAAIFDEIGREFRSGSPVNAPLVNEKEGPPFTRNEKWSERVADVGTMGLGPRF
jgi:hypothetical protein